MTEALDEQITAAFATEVSRQPPMSLRGGNDVDSYLKGRREAPRRRQPAGRPKAVARSYDLPTPFDAEADVLNDAYIDAHAYWALPHLDPDSWRHYLGPLMIYALERHTEPGTLVIQGLIWGLWPPEGDPPRFGSLGAEQTAAVVAFLEFMALEPRSEYQDDATKAIDDWWGRAGHP